MEIVEGFTSEQQSLFHDTASRTTKYGCDRSVEWGSLTLPFGLRVGEWKLALSAAHLFGSPGPGAIAAMGGATGVACRLIPRHRRADGLNTACPAATLVDRQAWPCTATRRYPRRSQQARAAARVSVRETARRLEAFASFHTDSRADRPPRGSFLPIAGMSVIKHIRRRSLRRCESMVQAPTPSLALGLDPGPSAASLVQGFWRMSSSGNIAITAVRYLCRRRRRARSRNARGLGRQKSTCLSARAAFVVNNFC